MKLLVELVQAAPVDILPQRRLTGLLWSPWPDEGDLLLAGTPAQGIDSRRNDVVGMEDVVKRQGFLSRLGMENGQANYKQCENETGSAFQVTSPGLSMRERRRTALG